MLKGIPSVEKRNFTLVTLANFLLFCNFSAFFLLPTFIKDIGGGEASVGFVMGSFGLASLGMTPAVGVLIDRWGRKRFMLVGAALMFVSSAGNVFIDNVDLLCLPRILQGLAFALFFTSAATAAADFAPSHKRGEGLGLFGAFTIASYAIGPTVGEFIIKGFGYRAFFLCASSFSIGALILVSLTSDAPMQKQREKKGRGFIGVVLSRRLAPIYLTNVALAGGFGSVLNFVSAYVKPMGLDVYYFFLVYSLTVTLMRFFGGRISDVVDRRKIAAPSLLFFAFSIALMSAVDSLFSMIAVAFIFSLSYGMLYPVLAAIVVDLAEPNERGRAVGLFNASFSFGINILAFFLGVIAELYGYPIMYLSAGALSFSGFLVFGIMARPLTLEKHSLFD
jgi:MFS family permease